MKNFFLMLAVCFMAGMAVKAQDNKAYEEAMVKMLEVSKTMEAMEQIAPQITAVVKQQVGSTNVPDSFWQELEQNMVNMYAKILKAMLPVYQKYLTIEDIREITKFYETPVGKKLAASNTKIAMEAMPIAQNIAMQTMQEFMENAKAKGYIK